MLEAVRVGVPQAQGSAGGIKAAAGRGAEDTLRAAATVDGRLPWRWVYGKTLLMLMPAVRSKQQAVGLTG